VITDHRVKLSIVARNFGIPPTSLRGHFYGKTISGQRGHQPVLREDEEKKLVEYLIKIQDLGHPLFPGQLRLKVALTTQTRLTPWSAVGVPSKSWLRKFKERHPEIAAMKAQGL
jgi:hypothetical protein